MSMFREAVKHMLAIELLICPRCCEVDIPKAKPTLEPEQDGSYTCRTCSHNFRPPAKETL